MMAEPGTSFGTLLRQLRSAAALSQEELAERAGLSVRGISDLERGARQAPRLETVRLLADALALAERRPGGAARRGTPCRRGRTAPRPAASPPLRSLPVPLTRLIGREAEVAALRARPAGRDDVRLLTLTGPGGVGQDAAGPRGRRRGWATSFPTASSSSISRR